MNNLAWKTSAIAPRHPGTELDEPNDNQMAQIDMPENSYSITGGQSPFAPDLFEVELLPGEMQKKRNRTFLSRMAVEVGEKVVLLFLRDILWIQSKGDLLCLHGKNADYDCRMTMTDLQNKLDPGTFLRVHRNAIVNLDHALEFNLPRNGNAFVHLSNGKALPISRNGRSALRQWLLSQSCFV